MGLQKLVVVGCHWAGRLPDARDIFGVCGAYHGLDERNVIGLREGEGCFGCWLHDRADNSDVKLDVGGIDSGFYIVK